MFALKYLWKNLMNVAVGLKCKLLFSTWLFLQKNL